MVKLFDSIWIISLGIFVFVHLPFGGECTSTGLRLTLEPIDTIVSRDLSAVLNCAAARGEVQPKISWKKDGKLLTFSGDNQRSILANGSLYFSPLQQHSTSVRGGNPGSDDEGQYQCLATWDGVGSVISKSAKLQSAWLAHFDEQPEDVNIVIGQTARFGCTAQGVPPPIVDWIKDDRPLSFIPNRMTILPSGALEIRQAQQQDAGSYKCNVTNLDRSLTSKSGRLAPMMNPNKKEDMAPIFTVFPKSLTVLASQNAFFECSSIGHPLPLISWLKDGISLDLTKDGRLKRIGDGNLLITDVVEADKGTYQCRAENSEDSVDVSANLEVQVSPKALISPNNIVYGYEKEDVELACKIVVGIPVGSIQWFKNGDMITEGDYFQLVNGWNLKILGLVTSDSGMYQCFAINPAGNAQSTLQLVVLKSDQSLPGGGEGADSSILRAPRDVVASTVSPRSVTLSWKPPLNIKSGGRILYYAVYFKSIESDRERVLNITQSTAEQVTVQGLRPNTRYTFRIVAYNIKGIGGESSRPLIVSTSSEQAQTPESPRFLKAWPVSPSKIVVQWAPPPPSAQLSPIQRYKIFYMEVGTAAELDDDKLLPSLNPTPFEKLVGSEFEITDFSSRRNKVIQVEVVNSLEAVLEDLRIFTEYSISVAGISKGNKEGLRSRQIRVTTLSDVPSDTPHNVSVEPGSSTTISLSWEPPILEFRNGLITGYKIKYKQKGRKKGATLTTDGNIRQATLIQLEPRTEYQIKMAAINVNGTGPFTEWISVSTLLADLDEDVVPDKPNSLHARPGGDSITITWTPPRNTDVLVRGYTIGWGRGIPDVYNKLVDGKRKSFTIDNLQPNSDYVISLRAYNQMGDGIPIYENVRTRDASSRDDGEKRGGGSGSTNQLTPPVGLRASTQSTTSISLQWSDSSLPLSPLSRPHFLDNRYYLVRYSQISDDDLMSVQKPKSSYSYLNTTELASTFTELKPSTLYEFSVKTVKGKVSSEWSLVAYNKTLPLPSVSTALNRFDDADDDVEAALTPLNTKPEDLTLLALTSSNGISSVVINWQPPRSKVKGKNKLVRNRQDENDSNALIGYLIRYTTNPASKEWIEETVADDVLTHQVFGLTPETIYYFHVTAKYSKWTSEPTTTKFVKTPQAKLASVPGSPTSTSDKSFPHLDSRPPQSNEIVLYLLIGLSVLFALASLVLCVYYRNRGIDSSNSSHSPIKTNNGGGTGKKGKKVELNPPDLWIHHDKMELKGVSKRMPAESPIESSNNLQSFSEEKVPLQPQQYNYNSSLGRKQAQQRYNTNNDSVIEEIQKYSLLSSTTLGKESAGTNKAYDAINNVRPQHGSIASESSTTSSQHNLNPSSSDYTTMHSAGTSLGTLTRRSSNTGGSNLKSFAVPLPPTTSQSILQQQSQQPPQIMSNIHQYSNTSAMRSSMIGGSGSNYLQGSPIKQHNIMPSAGLPRGGSEMSGMNYNNCALPPGLGEDSSSNLQKCYSTEELSLEISNLEGLMKDLNAITASEFQC